MNKPFSFYLVLAMMINAAFACSSPGQLPNAGTPAPTSGPPRTVAPTNPSQGTQNAAQTVNTQAPPPTATPVPATNTEPPTPVPTLGIGSTQIAPADGMVQVYVPGGEFIMGSDESTTTGPLSESPAHTIRVYAFWIDQTEVTNAMFAKFVEATGYKTDAEKHGSARGFFLGPTYQCTNKILMDGAQWRNPRGPSSNINSLESHPVSQMSWFDARDYCRWAGRHLPTEAEWEKAARGTDGRIYPWGNGPADGTLLNTLDINNPSACVDRNIDDGYEFTAPVGSYPKGASPYGALDMAGNVNEWVSSRELGYPYEAGYIREGGGREGDNRIYRGRSWAQPILPVKVRHSTHPDDYFDTFTIGFRCASSLVIPTPLPAATANTQPKTPDPILGIGSTQIAPADGMVQMYVPGGEFTMGSDSGNKTEKPTHTVTVNAFWIDKTEVTNAMFAKFVEATGYKTEAEILGWVPAEIEDGKNTVQVDGANWRNPRGPSSDIKGLDSHPVVQTSWNDARAYCSWVGRRLPTEAEWEKAARGTDGRMYPWGNGPADGSLLNFADKNHGASWRNANIDDGYKYTAPVGSYPKGASPYGALDMAGNVWEWVSSEYHDYAYDENLTPSENHILRGGSYYNPDTQASATIRGWHEPTYPVFFSIGFRCAASP